MTAQLFDAAFRRILDAISDGVYVTTDEREIVYWSKGAERITGFSADEVVGKHCFDDVLVHTDVAGRHLCIDGCPLQDCMSRRVDRTVNEIFLKRKDGERLPVYVKTTTFEEAGRVFGVEIFGELESVAGTGLAARVQELTTSSISDPLTGMFNRRYFDATLEQQFALFGRMGRYYGVLYLDVDNFKAVNDTFGHPVGDEALKFVSGIIARSARKMDVAARYGGDEFVVLCAVGDTDELESYAQRLVGLVRGSSFAPTEESGAKLSISVGGSMVGAADTDAFQALERADRAMYRVKHAGCDGAAVEDPA